MAYPIAERRDGGDFTVDEYKRIAADELQRLYEDKIRRAKRFQNMGEDAFYRGAERDVSDIPLDNSGFDVDNIAMRDVMADDALYRGNRRDVTGIPLAGSDNVVKELGRRLQRMYRNSLMSEGNYGN